MKKILSWIWIPIAALAGFFIGFFVRQPKINKLKKTSAIITKTIGKSSKQNDRISRIL